MARPCIVDRDCMVTAWRDWEFVGESSMLCRFTVNGQALVWPLTTSVRRRREIIWQPFGDGAPCPMLEERFPAVHVINASLVRRLPVCGQLYEWTAGEWTPCSSWPSGCGPGLQKRHVICQKRGDRTHQPVADHLCTNGLDSGERPQLIKPASVQQCQKPCPVDCQLSAWQPWSACDVAPCKNDQITTMGSRIRLRAVITEPSGSGRPCQHLAETNECGERLCKKLVIQEATGCPPVPTGGQFRHKESSRWGCAHTPGIHDNRNLTCQCNRHCPSQDTVERRRIWSSFGSCFPRQVGNNTQWLQFSSLAFYRERRRGCPTRFRLRPCAVKQKPERVYFWTSSKWTSCQWSVQNFRRSLLEKKYTMKKDCKVCGVGYRYRRVVCQQEFKGRIRELEKEGEVKCPRKNLYRPTNQVDCFHCCRQDCQYSAWSPWEQCSAELRCSTHPYATDCRGLQREEGQCNKQSRKGLQKRERFALVMKKNNGRACLRPIEHRVCSLSEVTCFHWKAGDWSSCIFPSGRLCLGGFQTRTVYCVGADNKPTTADRCYHKTRPASFRDCSADCDAVCKFSPWSQWSPCSHSCGVGHRQRTRVTLPGIDLSDARSMFTRACGTLKQVEKCGIQPCQVYKLRKHDWARWTPTHNQQGNGQGLCFLRRTRLLSCRLVSKKGKSSFVVLCGRRQRDS